MLGAVLHPCRAVWEGELQVAWVLGFSHGWGNRRTEHPSGFRVDGVVKAGTVCMKGVKGRKA